MGSSKLNSNRFLVISLVVVIIDQIVKVIVKLNMELGDGFQVIGNVVKIHFTENPGFAFGLTISKIFNSFGISMTEHTGKLILSIFSVVAVFFIFLFLNSIKKQGGKLPYLVALIFGGAVGNIIDRVFYGVWFAEINDYEGGIFFGRVVDMVYFDIWQGYLPNWIPVIGGDYYSLWPIFNIADAAISVGIVGIFIFHKTIFKK